MKKESTHRQKNENIGMLGEAFIQRQLDLGIDFDTAWDDWQEIRKKLMFIVVECPEVRVYDNRRISDCQERRRIREFAKSRLGKEIRSPDVSALGRVADWLQVEIKVQPYHMDRNLLAEWFVTRAEALELERGVNESSAEAMEIAESEEAIDSIARDMEQFSEDHSLWAVPPERLIGLYVNHEHRLLETSFVCDACGEEAIIPVDHSAGNWQRFRVVCRKCGRWNNIGMLIDDGGEARVVWSDVAEDGGET